MSVNPVAISPDTLLAEALRIMNENAILVLFVVEHGKLAGIVHMHDIVRAGLA
jgi:arabinose-5-phosphate isomerase